ncbi:MAG: alpha/beta hydrolase-fold protein [Candidatus Kapaibacterium sp.]|jgi:esterase/lipase superfamily enzyme
MDRSIHSWFSPALGKEMEVAVYGHSGPALLMFPSAAADYLEYERFHLIDAVQGVFESGKMMGFSINSINSESWLNNSMAPRDKAVRHVQYNQYISEEVVPFIRDRMGATERPTVYTTGVSFGAFHAMNMLLHRPDLFDGVIAMSGVYDLKEYAKGYYDEDVYFNSPIDFLPNLGDGPLLEALRAKNKIFLMSGKGNYEDPHASWIMGEVLGKKGIHNFVELWGEEWTHDWPTWRAMLPSAIERFF